VPAKASAKTMQASFADWIIAPRMRSLTFTRLFNSAYMVEPPEGEPPRRQASSLTGSSVSRVRSPFCSASNTRIMVMSLLMLAGSKSLSAFFS
jgi:hypothetical protein